MVKKSDEGITHKKEENFSEWYQELILKSGLADYSAVSGCIVYRPLAYAMWEKIRNACDIEFKKLGIQNTYFPLFIPERLLEKESAHVEGFTPEVAWVTHAGNTKLSEKLAVRPTSEAIMYDSYAKWIRSWRDLPLLLNQWNNVVRWEFNNPVPFFRGREFLWNELHTAFASEKEAIEHGKNVMKAYHKVTEEMMALPGIYGRKTENEKFAGAVFSEKTHHYLPNGRVIEGTCFHYDGQNFAKAYDIKFLNKSEKEEYAYQNTHAISTRMLGTMIAMHSDDKGLVLPPNIAPHKIAIVPILFNDTKKDVLKAARNMSEKLAEFEPVLYDQEEMSAGWKFNDAELKGIPLRIEIGPKDLENQTVVVVKRTNKEKKIIKQKDVLKEIPKLLAEMQAELYEKAKKLLEESVVKTDSKETLLKSIKNKKVAMIPLEDSEKTEEMLKEITGGAKTLFIDPKNTSAKGKKCVISGKPATQWVYVGKTY